MDKIQKRLNGLLDESLVAGLPQGVKDAIDAALAKGGSPAVIAGIAAERAAVAGIRSGDPTAGQLTRAAVEAYLRTRRAG